MTQHARGAAAREGEIPPAMSLEVSWTPVPFGRQLDPTAEEMNTLALAKLDTPSYRADAVKFAKENYIKEMNRTIEEALAKGDDVEDDPPTRIPVPNRLDNQVDPDEHLLCFDYLYFTSAYARAEFWWDDAPPWNMVGAHLHFSQNVLSIAIPLLRKTLSLPAPPSDSSSGNLEGSTIGEFPPYISVHIRRNDFTVWCGDVTRDDCLAPLSAYIRRVDEVRGEVLASNPALRKRVEAGEEELKVIVMTDEPHTTTDEELAPGTSEKWWAEIEKLGWKSVRHDIEGTAEEYGLWYPSVIDACLLAHASAFVGTDKSTYSLIAKRRVQDWANGPVRMVRWGNVGADDH